MLIISKLGKRQSNVTPETWKAMQDSGLASKFKVLSEDAAPEITKVKFTPPEIGKVENVPVTEVTRQRRSAAKKAEPKAE